MKTILICGSSGNIGSYLFKNLKSKYHVIGTSNSQNSNYLRINLLDKKNIKKSLSNLDGLDTLIFTVGLAHSKGKNEEYQKFEEINLLTLENIFFSLRELNKLPKKIIFTSTISVYGEKEETNFYYEKDMPSPKSPYAVTKLKAEKFLLDNYPQNCWILRLSPVYSDSFNLNLKRRISLGCLFFKIGDGNKQLTLCNIKNINTVVESIITDLAPSGIYNISDSQIYKYNDLLSYYGAKRIIRIPLFLIKVILSIAKVLSNRFFIENSIKLATDNIYPSHKIENFVKMKKNLRF